MPNQQNLPDENQTNPVVNSMNITGDSSTPSTSIQDIAPPIPEMSDLPPVVPSKGSFPTATDGEPKNDVLPANESKTTPPDLPPIIAGSIPKKGVHKKLVATILGILFLTGAVGTGVFLVKQNQEIREKAAGESYNCPPCGSCTQSCSAGGFNWDGSKYSVPAGSYSIKNKCSGVNLIASGQACACLPLSHITCADCEGYDTCDLPNVERYFVRGGTGVTNGWDSAYCGTQQVDITSGGGSSSYWHSVANTSPEVCSPSTPTPKATPTATPTPTPAPPAPTEPPCTATCVSTTISGVCTQASPCKTNSQKLDALPNVKYVVSYNNCAVGVKVDAGTSPFVDQITPANSWLNAMYFVDGVTTQTWNFCGSTGCWNFNANQTLYWRIRDNVTGQTVARCGPYSVPLSTATPKATPTVTPTPTASSKATPTTPSYIPPQCLYVKVYDTTWKELTTTQLSALKTGDKVRFAISGSPANQIDKAKFEINGTATSEITQKRPGTDEYWYEYTIPGGKLSFSIKGSLHHLTIGWF